MIHVRPVPLLVMSSGGGIEQIKLKDFDNFIWLTCVVLRGPAHRGIIGREEKHPAGACCGAPRKLRRRETLPHGHFA